MKGRGPYAALFDGGRQFRKQAGTVPGLDLGWYTDRRIFEESVFEHGTRANTYEQNDAMQDTEGFSFRQWGENMPGHMWVDNTHRYHWTGVDGLKFNAYSADRIAGDFPPLGAGDVEFLENPDDPEVDRSIRILRELDHREIRDVVDDPSEWIRRDLLNESGGTQLREPLAIVFPEVRGSVALELVDNSLFDPFDLREQSRYEIRSHSGEILESEQWSFLHPRGVYRLHLRPRRWKFFVTTFAIFVHVSFVELFYVREVFTQAWYSIPPCYPLRHNIIDANVIAGDNAVFHAFEHSQAAADLRRQILEAQYWTLSEAHIFSHIELTQMWIERAPPRKFEIVLGIERLDAGGREPSFVWIQNRRDLTSEYPIQDIAFFQEVPFFINT